MEPEAVQHVRECAILGLFMDSITTDHISPAGSIKAEGPAGDYLTEHQVRPVDFNSYGARRGNHQVMMRGTFANIRIKNQMLSGVEGGYTRHIRRQQTAIYDAAMEYKAEGAAAGGVCGQGIWHRIVRDWAAKGTRLLGVRAVIAQSFERIHRSNLIGMGVLPLQFQGDDSWEALGLKGDETVTINGLDGKMKPQQTYEIEITSGGKTRTVTVKSRIDTADELDYFTNGGILPYVLRQLAA